jgi:hypothetical protein
MKVVDVHHVLYGCLFDDLVVEVVFDLCVVGCAIAGVGQRV